MFWEKHPLFFSKGGFLKLGHKDGTPIAFYRCLKLNRYSLEVHKMKIIFLLCRDGKYDEAAEGIGELIQYYDRYEPKSHYLYYEAGKLFSRVVSAMNILLYI